MRRGLWVLILMLTSPALAETMPRPMPRPVAVVAPAPEVTAKVATQRTAWVVPRPKQRPAGVVFSTPVIAPVQLPSLIGEVAPKKRPKGLGLFRAAAVKSKPGKAGLASRKGSVCNDPAIKGEEIPPIVGKVQGCGVSDPVRVTSVSGVQLSQAATLDCNTARALKTWVDKGLQPAFGETRVVELRVAAHYICRSRNNMKGAKISEHGRGKAIDIAGFVLDNGQSVMVANGYDKAVRSAHKAACGIFGTTLGPGSDGYHEDHLHFDTAAHRNGPYCR